MSLENGWPLFATHVQQPINPVAHAHVDCLLDHDARIAETDEVRGASPRWPTHND
jgi:hypothetical protein